MLMNSAYFIRIISLLLVVVGLGACETIIDANIASGPAQLAVDAWLTDQPGEQRIKLVQTANYFNNGPSTPATSASVVVSDNAGRVLAFTDPDNDGVYTWKPAKVSDTTRLGIIGRTYTLGIQYQGNTYASAAQMPRTTSLDSLIFRKKTITPVSKEEGYRSEFYAVDTPGAVDYYYLRYYRNGVLQNRPQDISLAYDGAFRGSANTDGLTFIRPIRQSLNPEKLFALNDTMRVEMRTLTAEGYLFWELLRSQLQNAGLFATPPANVPTNIRNATAGGPKAVGFFFVSPVRTRTAIVSKETLRGGD